MMDHLGDVEVSRDVADLYEASASPDRVSQIERLCAVDELFANASTLRADIPTWIYRSILIYDCVDYDI